MARTCPFCAEEIKDAAVVCKHCGRDLPPSTPPSSTGTPAPPSGGGWLNAVALIAVVVVVVVVLLARSGGSSGPTDAQVAQARDLTQRSVTAGIISRYTCTGNEAFVNPVAWAAFNADQKRGLAISLAYVCEGQRSGNRITVFDAQSGKELASASGGRATIR